MENIAIIKKVGGRYELFIGGKLKAYTQGNHAKGKLKMIDMVKEKGYEVQVEAEGEKK